MVLVTENKYNVEFQFNISGNLSSREISDLPFQLGTHIETIVNVPELQDKLKLARITDVDMKESGIVEGKIIIPFNTNLSLIALIAPAIENINSIGPYRTKFTLVQIKDASSIDEFTKRVMNNGDNGDLLARENTKSTSNLLGARTKKYRSNQDSFQKFLRSVLTNVRFSDIPIIVGLVLLFTIPFSISQDDSYADSVALSALYILAMGIVWKFVRHILNLDVEEKLLNTRS